MPQFNNFASLESYLKTAVSDTLRKEVFEEVKKCEQEHIQSDVYDVYSPSVYQRRGLSNGLGADDNIVLTEIDNLSIEVVNTTDPNSDYNGTTDKYLSDLVEYGDGYNGYYYDYPTNRAFTESRPFQENTVKDLQTSKKHIQAMREGLSKRGIQTT
jgi:hypothetical protein